MNFFLVSCRFPGRQGYVKRSLTHYTRDDNPFWMEIRSVRHKGLKRFISRDDPSGLPATFVEKIRNILSFLQDMGSVDELKAFSSWDAHLLTGDRKGTWSLTVTRNWRITFRLDPTDNAIIDLDYEDYH